MRFSTLLPLLLAAGVTNAQFGGFGQGQGGQGQNGQNNNNNNNNNNNQNNQNNQNQNGQNNNDNNQNNNNNNNNALALDPANVQDASQSDGFDQGQEDGQAASDTDDANFINFCTGKTLTNGLQIREGSCNGIVMGEIPAANQMVSAVIVSPANGDIVGENEAIDFSVQIANLQAGSFTNPDVTYYAAPQALQGGQIVGHTHITVQDIGNDFVPQQPLDAETFAFFKGINDAGNGNGLLSANLAEGLPAGCYRACSMTSASNHQPVVMPVAQRGPQDDCIRFQVGNQNNCAGNQNNNNNNNNQNQNGQNNNNNQQGQQGQQGQGQDQQGQQGQDQQGQQGQDQQGQQGQDQQGQQGQDQQGQQGQDQQGQQGQDQQGQQGQDQQGQQGQDQQGQQGQDQQGQQGQDQAQQGQQGQDQAQQGQQGQDQAQQGQQGQDQAQQGQQGQGQQGQGQQGQGQGGFGQGGFGGRGRGRGRGRFGKPKFAVREFIA